ncbi:MAG: WhiB family transcriptional regulator [Nitriliruptor sp.]|nr:MAG: WhiB family transcriptional regulator [Nitriliruptor sp.]
MQGAHDEVVGAARLALVTETVDVGEAWEQDALCRGAEGALFFGPHGFEPKRERAIREEAAKAICARCPALLACREHALRHGELYGVWGGLGEAERRTLLEREGRIAQAG